MKAKIKKIQKNKFFSKAPKKIIEIIEHAIAFAILVLAEYHHFQNR